MGYFLKAILIAAIVQAPTSLDKSARAPNRKILKCQPETEKIRNEYFQNRRKVRP